MTSAHQSQFSDQATQVEQICAYEPWMKLSGMIRDFQPDVVVLVARKMPRLAEFLKLHFGTNALLVSDFAIPFCRRQIEGARVAIVDDVVNVGSTLENAATEVERFAPALVQLFSLARRKPTETPPRTNVTNVSYAIATVLTDQEYRAHVRGIPHAISNVNKPYDLAFPIFRAGYALPYSSAWEIIPRLHATFGTGRVHILPSPYLNSPVRRLTILPSSEDSNSPGYNTKIRLFLDDRDSKCSIVPIVVPTAVTHEDNLNLVSTAASAIHASLKRVLDDFPTEGAGHGSRAFFDAAASIALYSLSLDWFLSSHLAERLKDIFDISLEQNLSLDDAALLFGPIARSWKHLEVSSAEILAAPEISITSSSVPTSPFIEKFNLQKLREKALSKLSVSSPQIPEEGMDCYNTIVSIVDAISEMVGAEAPDKYCLTWPVSTDQIATNSYARLRIGPTFSDLVHLCGDIHLARDGRPVPRKQLKVAVSLMLDALIDQGALVPTFAYWDDKIYRIYRRGEAPPWDEPCNRVLYAWADRGKPLSITRVAKILATMGFSTAFAETVQPHAATRGYVGTLPPSAVDTATIIIPAFLRNTGQLTKVRSDALQDE